MIHIKMKYFIVSLFLIIQFNSFCQEVDKSLQELYSVTKLADITKSFYDNGWIEFDPTLKIEPNLIFVNYKEYFGLSEDDYMKLEKVNSEENGMTHYRFQQYYKGIKVEGMFYTIHAKDGIAISANGKLVSGLHLDINLPISKNKAKSVLDTSKSSEYKLHGKKGKVMEDEFCELLITKKANEAFVINKNFILVEIFNVVDEKNEVFEVRLRSNDHSIWNIKSKRRYSNIPDQQTYCNTLYNGNKSVMTYRHEFSFLDCMLLFCCDPFYHFSCYGGNKAYWVDGNFYPGGCKKPLHQSSNNLWGEYVQNDLSAMWAFQKTREYFLNTFGHAGLDGNDVGTEIVLLDATDEPNSYFDPDNGQLVFCTKTFSGVSTEMLSLDLVGHEYTHGIIYHSTGGLAYSGETGAIEEGLADVFGGMVQTYVEGYNASRTYTMGEDVFLINDYKRSMSNPNSLGVHSIDSDCRLGPGQPDTYLGQYWDTRGCDNSRVHTNSTVMSHWFYLLAEGGSGVQGIGRNSASQIAFSFMNNYFGYGANFSDARNGTLMAASYLYGVCSNQFLQVANAWAAVGVSSSSTVEYNISNPCQDVSALHSIGEPYIGIALDEINFNCNLSTNNSYTELNAVNSVKLTSGFKVCNAEKFIARTISCVNFSPLLKSSEISISKNMENSLCVDSEKLCENYIVYPNPSDGCFSIKSENGEKMSFIEIYNSNGKKILDVRPNDCIANIDMSDQIKGVYILIIQSNNNIHSRKIVVN